MFKASTTVLLAAALLASWGVHAAQTHPMTCSVTVDYSLNNVSRLTYVRDFVVSTDTPFSEDFSTATRFRFFDAYLAYEDNTPVVTIVFDADVSVFSTVDFTADLKVHDQSKGESATGTSSFFTSAPGATGAHRTTYVLNCARAKI